jgi:hypothetical protein
LTPCCGLQVQKPTQALKSVKDPGNTFDINHTWSRTLPSLIYFLWVMEGGLYKYPTKKYIKDGKFLDHLGLKSKVLPGPLTDLGVWVGFCRSSSQQSVKYEL